MHGILEWLLAAFIIVLGFVLNKWVPFKKIRYPLYGALYLTAFIFDLNYLSFTSDNITAVFFLLVLTAMAEILWLCRAKKNKILMGFGLLIFVPLFISIYTATLEIVPLPCHQNNNVIVDKYTCGVQSYIIKKRPKSDFFEPAHVYTLYRLVPQWPIKKRVDRYITPKGYYDASIKPKHKCTPNGVKIDIYVNNDYVLWSLLDKIERK